MKHTGMTLIRGNNDEMLTGRKGVEGSTRTQIRNSEYDVSFLAMVPVLVINI